MCGIMGAVSRRDISRVLLEGLRRLEYRGYDSAGIAVIDAEHHVHRIRTEGKVQALTDALSKETFGGCTGIAHTRWATHGRPSERNAHPHVSHDEVAIVHNGIIFSHEDVYQMEDVKSIDVAQGFWGKIFNTGTVEFYAFRMHKNIYLDDINDPYAVAANIHQMHPMPLGLAWPATNKRAGKLNTNIVLTEEDLED